MDALILAGGENSRIPFLKGFLEIGGSRIIESNVRLLKGLFKRVLISTNSPEIYFYLGEMMVGDIIKHKGPISGIYSALNIPDVPDVFVTACDMPFINVILIQHMINKWDGEHDSVIPVFDNRPQPLFGIYSEKITGKIEDSIKKGRKSLMELLKRINVLYIKEEEVRSIDKEGRTFVNINTIEDFKREGGRLCLV